MSERSLTMCRPSELVSFGDEIDCLFDELLFRPRRETNGYIFPPVNIKENKGHLEVSTEIPGMKKEDIKVEVRDNVLSISGEKKQQREQKEETFYRIEQCYGKFDRRITLPSKVDASKISAEYKEGILNISLPIAESAKQIEVQVK